jgi:hypothetical protein
MIDARGKTRGQLWKSAAGVREENAQLRVAIKNTCQDETCDCLL